MRLPTSRLALVVGVLTLAVFAVLVLGPRSRAQDFLETSRQDGVQAAVARLDNRSRDQLYEYFFINGYPDGANVSLESTRWDLAKTGSCTAVIQSPWARWSASGVDQVRITFQPLGRTSIEIRNVNRRSHTMTLL